MNFDKKPTVYGGSYFSFRGREIASTLLRNLRDMSSVILIYRRTRGRARFFGAQSSRVKEGVEDPQNGPISELSRGFDGVGDGRMENLAT